MSIVDSREREDPEPPGPDHLERRALPAHLHPAAAALFDDLPEPVAGSAVQAAIARLEARAAELAARAEPHSEVIVDAFAVRSVAGCPAAMAGPGEPFSWTPATAARTIGLRAVAYHLRGASAGAGAAERGTPPVEASVEAVMAELVGSGGDRTPGPWLAALTPPARAVAVSQARRWAEQAVAWLPLRLVGPRGLRFLNDDWWPPRGRATSRRGGSPVESAQNPDQPIPATFGVDQPVRAARRELVVHGRRDITVEVSGLRVAVTVTGGAASGSGLADVDALTAFAAVACDPKGRLVRVVRVHPASGEVAAVDVTPALVARGAEVVLATASVLADLASGAEVAASPGPTCPWCPRLGACPAGAAWAARPDRRSMGLPLLDRRR